MILMKEYVSLTNAAIKMGKRHFYSDHSNGCLERKRYCRDMKIHKKN